jgi:hypothetical protein
MVNDTNNQFHIDQARSFQYILPYRKERYFKLRVSFFDIHLVCNLFGRFDQQLRKEIHEQNR